MVTKKMKIMVTSLSGGTGKTVLAYNIAKRFTKPLLVDLTENMHLSVIFNVPMFASGYQTFQAGHKNLDELVVKSDAVSFLPRGLHGTIELESLSRLLAVDGFDAVIVDTQLSAAQINELSPLFDIIVIPMRCDVSVKAENWLLNMLSTTLKEKSPSSVIIPVILRNRMLDAKISITTKIDERKISKHFPVCANIIKEVFTVENDPDVHDKTWQNRAVEGKYGSVVSAMVRRFIELKKKEKKPIKLIPF
jgi:cellulose biosynthesis protein BcsQ